MKALSIRQPWAWLIVQGYKDIENRTWRTDYRGLVLIHAGYIFDQDGYEYVKKERGLALPSPEKFKRGGIVGIAEIVDCVTDLANPWFTGPYGFVLKNMRLLPFMAMPGKPGIFEAEVPHALKGLLHAVHKKA
jgi:hypothetical protein